MEKKRQEETENSTLIGTIAETITGKSGRSSILYIIGDYLYSGGGMRSKTDGSTVLDLKCSTYAKLCKGRAILDKKTLRVLKLSQSHCCTRDPDLKLIVQMQSEMKNLADTTRDKLKDIFNDVCLKNPAVASRIDWPKMYGAMKNRRVRAKKMRKDAQVH